MRNATGESAAVGRWMLPLGKIVEGALSKDDRKVRAYASQLSTQLREDGQVRAAERIEEMLSRDEGTGKLSLARGTQVMPIPVDSEGRLPVADESPPRPVPIVLHEEVNKQVNRFVRYVMAADRLTEQGVGISPSMLIYGPPGCGKTQLAKHIAACFQLPLITARADALISSYLGSTAKNLRALFDHAASRPCVLFLDELDSIGKMRDDEHELGELKRVVISLLQNIDALDRNHVLIAATNHEHLLDPAIWRRFAFHVKVDRPNHESRLSLLELFLGDRADQSALQIIASASDGLSGADLREISDQAIRDAVLAESTSVDVVSLLASISSRIAHKTPRDRDDIIRSVFRNSPKLRQRDVARLFGINQSTISRILKVEVRHG